MNSKTQSVSLEDADMTAEASKAWGILGKVQVLIHGSLRKRLLAMGLVLVGCLAAGATMAVMGQPPFSCPPEDEGDVDCTQTLNDIPLVLANLDSTDVCIRRMSALQLAICSYEEQSVAAALYPHAATLASHLGDSEIFVREHLMATVVYLDPQPPETILPFVLPLVEDSETTIRRYAVDALSRMATDSQSAIDLALIRLSDDSSMVVRSSAARYFHDLHLVHPEVAANDSRILDGLVDTLAVPSTELRVNSLRAIRAMAMLTEAPGTLPTIANVSTTAEDTLVAREASATYFAISGYYPER